MSNLLFKMVGLAIGVPIAIVVSQGIDAKREAKYQITDMGRPILSSCELTLSVNDQSFNKGASNGDGCACIAKHATSTIAPERLDEFKAVLKTAMNMSKQHNKTSGTTSYYGEKVTRTADQNEQSSMYSEMEKSLTALQKKLKMPEREFYDLVGQTYGYLGTCGKKETHEGASLANIVRMTPIGQSTQVARVEKPKPKPKPKSNKTNTLIELRK